MFINIINFSPIRVGKEAEFRQWFAWSNEEYPKHKGFIRRRLLLPREGGNYAAFVEQKAMILSWPCIPATPRQRQADT